MFFWSVLIQTSSSDFHNDLCFMIAHFSCFFFLIDFRFMFVHPLINLCHPVSRRRIVFAMWLWLQMVVLSQYSNLHQIPGYRLIEINGLCIYFKGHYSIETGRECYSKATWHTERISVHIYFTYTGHHKNILVVQKTEQNYAKDIFHLSNFLGFFFTLFVFVFINEPFKTVYSFRKRLEDFLENGKFSTKA